MQLPALQGTFDPKDFFIYAACDSGYFDEFGSAFIGSIRANTSHNIHLHIFNPVAEQINYCQRQGVGVTWEHAHQTLFASAGLKWKSVPNHEPNRSQYDRTVNAMHKGQDHNIIERMQKTYYACARFIRLAELYSNQEMFAVDIDAVIRQSIPSPGADKDFYIHHISGKRARFLAGGLWLNGTNQCANFLQQYAKKLKEYFDHDHIYWGLDQDVLDSIVPQFNHGQLAMPYIDWNMSPNSYVWTAKGLRKHLSVFINEQKKYSV